MVKHFVAGETLEEALGVCRALEAQGMTATLDHWQPANPARPIRVKRNRGL